MPPVAYIDDPQAVRAVLEPFLAGDLLAWHGLPNFSYRTLKAAVGRPAVEADVTLGWYPARRLTYPMERPSGGFHAFVRDNRVIMLEALVPPPSSVLASLGPPAAIKPHEILAPDAYVHEYLYAGRGLVVSVAEPFEASRPLQVLRCRAIRALESPAELGPEFYRSFEDQEVW